MHVPRQERTWPRAPRAVCACPWHPSLTPPERPLPAHAQLSRTARTHARFQTTELEPINANKVFGVDLATLKAAGVAFDEARNLPTVVITCVEFLLEGDRIAEQGIFRLAGDHQRIQALRDSVDQGEPK